MTTSGLTATIERYEAALAKLEHSQPNPEGVLEILNGRDAVRVALEEQKYLPTSRLNRVIELDGKLRGEAERIVKVIGTEKLRQWQESVHPSPEAWWWRLETIASHPWDRFDGLWKVLTLASWTFNISLLANLATRFFGGGVGFIGAAAVTLPSLIALLQAGSQLTKTGREGFDSLLVKFKVPPHWREEAKLGSTLAVSGIVAVLWFSLPAFSNFYTRSGFKNYQERNLGSAEQDLEKAISLNTDNAKAHFYLGVIYEDYQELEKAQKQYRLAMSGEVAGAYNNLARLYVKDKKYAEAVNLAERGLDSTEEDIEIRYSLLKNWGWARLKQKRYEEAEELLEAAISIVEAPENIESIYFPGSSYCLLAQTLEEQGEKAEALQQWQMCCQLGKRENIDEDGWLYLAQQKLKEAGKSCSQL